MTSWKNELKIDPIKILLSYDNPAIEYFTLRPFRQEGDAC